MSIEKAKEILKKQMAWMKQVNIEHCQEFKVMSEALAELEAAEFGGYDVSDLYEAESKPEPGEFTKKMRMRILRDQPMVDAETASFDQLVVIATEALEHLDEACGLIDSLQERFAAKDKQLKAARLLYKQAEEIFRLNDKCVEMTRAKDKKIERLKDFACNYAKHGPTCAGEVCTCGFIEAREQALKGNEREL